MRSLFIVFVLSCTSLSALATEVTPGKFQMFSTTEPNEFCETGTELVLDNGELSGSIALMTNFVMGMCEIAVFPNPRFINLELKGEKCGSKIYEGKLIEDGRMRTIEITDHRLRLCEDMIPSLIVMKMTDSAGFHGTMYSLDN